MDKFFRLYVRSFFAPVSKHDPTEQSSSTAELVYHMQRDSPPGRNPPASRSPHLYARAGAMEVDFHGHDLAAADSMRHLHRWEADIRSKVSTLRNNIKTDQ